MEERESGDPEHNDAVVLRGSQLSIPEARC